MRNYNIMSIMPLTDKRRYYIFNQIKEGISTSFAKRKDERKRRKEIGTGIKVEIETEKKWK